MKIKIAGAITISFAVAGCCYAADLSPAVVRAIQNGNVAALRPLITPANVDAKDKNGFTALMISTGTDKTDCIQVLLDAGADKNATSAKGFTALMVAASEGHLNSVRLLLSAGVDVNVKTPEGITASIIAREKGSQEIVQLLRATAERSPGTSPSTMGVVLVRCDVDCRLSVDGDEISTLKARQPKKVPLSLGSHIIEAVSLDSASLRDEKTIRLTTTDQQIVEMEIQGRQEKAEAERRAKEEQIEAERRAKQEQAETNAHEEATRREAARLDEQRRNRRTRIVGTYELDEPQECGVVYSISPSGIGTYVINRFSIHIAIDAIGDENITTTAYYTILNRKGVELGHGDAAYGCPDGGRRKPLEFVPADEEGLRWKHSFSDYARSLIFTDDGKLSFGGPNSSSDSYHRVNP
jgi:hypothetical protein